MCSTCANSLPSSRSTSQVHGGLSSEPPASGACELRPEGPVLARLVEQLHDFRPWLAVLNWSPLDRNTADTANLRRVLSASGWYAKQYDCFGNWYLPCAGIPLDDYMKSRDSKLRNTWSRKRKNSSAPLRATLDWRSSHPNPTAPSCRNGRTFVLGTTGCVWAWPGSATCRLRRSSGSRCMAAHLSSSLPTTKSTHNCRPAPCCLHVGMRSTWIGFSRLTT
jgi:hypothetical protein